MNLFMRFPGGLQKAFTMSYDDGVRQDRRLIEIMNKYNLTKRPVDATPLFTNNIDSNNFESILNEYRHKNQFLFKDTTEDIEFFNQIIHK